jgi:hypothetical protein
MECHTELPLVAAVLSDSIDSMSKFQTDMAMGSECEEGRFRS